MRDDVARDLDDRPERLEQHVVRQRQHADDAVARVADHVAVVAEHLEQAALPAVALVAEDLGALRHLRPAHRIGHEHEAIRLLALAHDAVHAHAQLHVLADRLVLEAAGVEHLLRAGRGRRRRR